MKTIKIYDGNNYFDVEVEDAFADGYAAMEYADALIERKETRRHQSLDKSLDNGFDIPDTKETPEQTAVRKETENEVHIALSHLTEKQRIVIISYAVNGLSFQKIADQMEVSKNTVREYYQEAVKKMKKYLS